MITEQDLSQYYDSLKEIFARVRDDVHFFLQKRLLNCGNDEISRIYGSSRISERVKTYESLLRKIRRDNVDCLDAIPDTIEDMIGFRISTPNKVQARQLFDWFRSEKANWFCKTIAEPKFVPYTLEDRNIYSLRTGYQAYQMTFVVERGFTPFTENRKWPCEVQIMAQVWEFWGNYSRKYFYGNSGTNVVQLLPYNVAISRILDSADDLMIATSDLLLRTEAESDKGTIAGLVASDEDHSGVSPLAVRDWLVKNVKDLFDQRVNIPNELFLAKIASELNTYQITLNKLKEILSNKELRNKYESLLSASQLGYLPMYQQILCMILLYLNYDIRKIVDRVNSELFPLGIQLHVFQSGT